MTNQHHSHSSHFLKAFVVSVALFTVACQSSQPPQPGPPPAVSKTAVFVIFEGPWAIVEDPKDPHSVLVLAPKTKGHRDLDVSASNDAILNTGTYDLSVPAHGAATNSPLDASFAQAKIPAKDLQHALDDKSGRYVIRLPKPESYVAAKRVRSRIGPDYPPAAATEQNYATEVSFRYNVESLNGFSLAGTPDTGAFNPLLLQLDTPTIRFAIEPAQLDDPADKCNTHSRETFHDVVNFLGITLFIDFPNDPDACHKSDPQLRAASQKASLEPARIIFPTPSPKTITVPSPSPADRKTLRGWNTLAAIDEAGPVARSINAAMYLFHYTSTDCKTAIIFLSVTP